MQQLADFFFARSLAVKLGVRRKRVGVDRGANDRPTARSSQLSMECEIDCRFQATGASKSIDEVSGAPQACWNWDGPSDAAAVSLFKCETFERGATHAASQKASSSVEDRAAGSDA